MAWTYDQAVEALHRAPHEAFVAERKRLAADLRAAGDRPGAARLVKLGRPPLSAWAVNQLWWRAREPFERLLAAGARLRAGDLGAAAERRDAVAALKAHAAAVLAGDGHAVSEGTLRRVTTTLSALAASGGFEPEPPGALSADRDPPGFDLTLLGGALGVMPADDGTGVGRVPAHDRAASPASPALDSDAHAPSPERPRLASAVTGRLAAAPNAAASERAASERAASERAASERAASEKAASEKAASEKAASEKAASEKAASERAASERAAREKAASERAAREKAASELAERESAERERARREEEERRLRLERAVRRAERERLDAALPTLRADLERRRREVDRLRAEVRRVEGLAEEARVALEEAEAQRAALGAEE